MMANNDRSLGCGPEGVVRMDKREAHMKRNTVAFAAIVIAIASLAVARICLAAAGNKSAK